MKNTKGFSITAATRKPINNDEKGNQTNNWFAYKIQINLFSLLLVNHDIQIYLAIQPSQFTCLNVINFWMLVTAECKTIPPAWTPCRLLAVTWIGRPSPAGSPAIAGRHWSTVHTYNQYKTNCATKLKSQHLIQIAPWNQWSLCSSAPHSNSGSAEKYRPSSEVEPQQMSRAFCLASQKVQRAMHSCS